RPAAAARGGYGWVSTACGSGGAAADAGLVAIGELLLHPQRVPGDIGDERQRQQPDAGIGPDDEGEMGGRVHRAAPRAAWRRIVSARRRRISVRMRMTCSRPKSRVKASIIASSGVRIDAGMCGPDAVKTLAGWCRVF